MRLQAALLAFALTPFVTNAQELVVNGTFNNDISFWLARTQYGSVQWSAQDATATPGSGSLSLQADFPCYGPDCYFPSVSQCVPVTPLLPFVLAADARGTGGQVDVIWYPTTDCTGTPLSSAPINIGATSSWQHYEQPTVSPVPAQSAEVVALPFAFGALPSASFDNISLRAASANAVPTLSSWHLITLASALVASAVVILRSKETGAA